MEKLKKKPGKKLPEIEEPKTKESSPHEIETPVPPQVMNPSAPRDIEKKKSSHSADKRKKYPLKKSQLDT
jgi:hypothetical protein